MPHRFYIPPERISGGRIQFTDEQRKQLRNVLRLGPGDVVRVFDGSGREFTVRLESLDGGAAGVVFEASTPDTEPRVRLTLVQGLPKGEKLELVLQKCTEIGVSEFLIADTARSVPRISADRFPGRLERWRSVVREAAEQSGRVRLPSVEGIVSFKQAVERVASYGSALIAWEEERGRALMDLLPELDPHQDVAILIGPEGGFTTEEVNLAVQAGITPVSLGRRILRTETAAIVAGALIIYTC
jgi:16S rRNA (uracil1498-N3)-methyltransferase